VTEFGKADESLDCSDRTRQILETCIIVLQTSKASHRLSMNTCTVLILFK
jgi:hypothetical protein